MSTEARRDELRDELETLIGKFTDVLVADDGELSDDVGKAIDAFNAVLKAQGPSCWYPGKQRINMEPLWAELKADLEKEKAEGLR